MPWQEKRAMEERVEFVLMAREKGANISALCREYHISRKTGYKLLRRYEAEGIEGARPRSRRPLSSPCVVSSEIVCKIVELRQEHPRWGGRKLQMLLERELLGEGVPSVRSIERVLERCSLSSIRRRRARKHISTEEIVQPNTANDVWTIDFKGDWLMKNGQRCYPLTVRDEYTKFIIDIAAFPGTLWKPTQERLISCFERYGTPRYIRSDNGNPFASIRAIGGLSRLSAWWIKLGITPNRIPPASPQYNGAHERMHLDMAKELETSPGKNLAHEQARFDAWKAEYNSLRPHERLGMKTPESCYQKSRRKYDPNESHFLYPKHLELRKVCGRGMVAWGGRRIFISNSLKHEFIAFKRKMKIPSPFGSVIFSSGTRIKISVPP